ncbi:MBL fold metallo-hydrolase [Magnetospirillum sulfuroxidans]|uniref:MBL fold metallo-hydrolase n=1 Tax=Magnetospirillum sulfuroxidans TaxID=611300 RepID=A0ABS5I7M5_9PROT|nr:MBL fold metallo-hydrolase [Magnetospirillum sulfuroxidans]MBR9970438.1 MBL fold metallo-hydrolase [Magnetospirillum sulfuroxidans]
MGYVVKFWGVRGSIACPSPDHVVYGGNTSCLEFSVGDNTLIFDAGTGIRLLGQSLLRRGVSSATLLLTHTHWDHINGFPFFAPAFNPAFSLAVMAGHLGGQEGGIEAVLAKQMENPTFPVPLATMRSQISFRDFKAGEDLHPFPDVLVKSTPLNHPNGATGYRVEYGGKAVCYVTDTEHVPGQPDRNVLDLIQGADLVIYDSTYTDDEFPAKVHWGHSTWQEGVRLCRAAGVQKLAIFHHDPDHDDQFMARLEDEAKQSWAGATVARDGMDIVVI